MVAGWDRELEELARRPEVVAVGETGLDYHYDFSDRPTQARVQRRMRNAHFDPARLEAEHEERVLGRHAGTARDERGIAVELDSGELDRAFRMRRGDYRVHLAGERRVDRGLRGIERGFAVRCCDRADVQLAGFELPALDEGQRAVAPICVRGARHAAEIRLESTGVGMRLDRAAIADEERPADFFHLRS